MSNSLNLALTKIGDLLVENKITIDKSNQSIDSISLKIPNYQRPYKWSSKNVIQLFDDIIEAKNSNKETYRVGTLILHQNESGLEIVDGQQRTITFSLLLKALGQSKIAFLDQNIIMHPASTKNIPNNYRTLARRINQLKNQQDKEELLVYIKNNCELIVIITDDISEAFQFFDSQNVRGKKLFPHDLLKAFHLREMSEMDNHETEKIVKTWEELDQEELSSLFSDYLYRVKEWLKGNKAEQLNEQNIYKFKGITRLENFPYAQFYKGAYAYADSVNHSAIPFVTGGRGLKLFQIDTPVIAGKPFFEYTKYYFNILKEIKNNDQYKGYYVNGNPIIKTLDVYYKNGTGNGITRLLFDTSILLYVDRFCSEKPSKQDFEMLDQFIIFAFIWAYSLRAQYQNLGWASAQNFVLGNPNRSNSFNIYKEICETDSPTALLSILSDKVSSLPRAVVKVQNENVHEQTSDGIYTNYLHYFIENKFLEDIQ